MATGACGINCDCCGLNLLGVCSTCGPGGSEEGSKKLAAQERILGAPCPILACAFRKEVHYCSRDCDHFPCPEFKSGPYPFSGGYLKMQERRRGEAQALAPSGDPVRVPEDFWDDLGSRDPAIVCSDALVKSYPPAGYLLPFLQEYLLVDGQDRSIKLQAHGRWEGVHDSLLELLCLLYLLNAGPRQPAGEMVGVQQMKSRHFFSGPHEIRTAPLLSRYGHDPEGFRRAAEKLAGEPLPMADAAFKFHVFPKVPLFYLLWKGDDEFPPRLSILFDRSIEHHLAPDAVWGLTNLISRMLLKGR